MISAVLVNLNEEEKLDRCLASLAGFAREIVVLDLGSTDESVEICKKYNAKVFKHDFVSFVEKVRNYIISKANGDWILVLDPDEAVSDSLKYKLEQISKENKVVAVNIPRKNIFFGRWIAHTNWWPDKHIRFFKKGQVEWISKIHKYPEVAGQILDLDAKEDLAILHFGYDSVTQFLERQNRYSTIEAENRFEAGERFSRANFFGKPIREFLVRFVRHAGFLDGFYGFALTVLMMIYQIQVVVKLWELGRKEK